MLKKLVLAFMIVGLGLVSVNSAVSANNGNGNQGGDNQAQETCPTNGTWTKTDGVTGTSVTVTAPAGKLIAEVCYKAATGVVYYPVTPPASSVTITSTVTNANDEVQAISHYSIRLIDAPTTPVVLVASASVSKNPATCELGEVLVYGAIANAVFSGTANGQQGPGSYNVTAAATGTALFAGGSTTQNFSSPLAGPLTNAECDDIDDEEPETPIVPVTPIVPTTPSDDNGDVLGDSTVGGAGQAGQVVQELPFTSGPNSRATVLSLSAIATVIALMSFAVRSALSRQL